MTEEAFSAGRTFLHRADPRFKVLGFAVFTAVAAVLSSQAAAGAALAFGALLCAASRPPLGPLVRRMAAVNAFIAFLWLVLPVSMPGEELLPLGPLALTSEGLGTALLITLKCNAIVLALTGLAATSRVPDLGRALSGLGVPDKISFLILFSYRYLDVIAAEYARLSRAARARCFEAGPNRHTYRTVANLLGMVLVRSYDRSQRVYQAMLLRGFDGRFHSLAEHRAGFADALLLAALILAAAGLAAWEALY